MRKFKKQLPVVSAIVLLIAAGLLFADTGASLPFWLITAVAAVLLIVTREGRCTNFVVWRDEYSVGFDAIDDDHKKLLNLMNNLQAAIMCNTGEEFERAILEELMDYTRYHLHREEELMQTHDYLDYEGHKAQHDQMIIQAKVFVDRYEAKGKDALIEVADYLRLWLLQHINIADKKFARFLIEKGVT